MLIARWQIDARFGHKDEAIKLIKQWRSEVAPQIGWDASKMRMTTGSIGANESTIVTEVEVSDLGSLNEAWNKLAEIPAHADWGRRLEPYVVSSTNRWEVYRVL